MGTNLEALNTRAEDACLRRDLLISKTLGIELPRIIDEIPYRNSPKARRYLEAKLMNLFASGQGARQISLALDPSVFNALVEVCRALNVPRETLLNRLIMMLGVSSDALADQSFSMIPLWLADPTSEPAESGGNVEMLPDLKSDFTRRGRYNDFADIKKLASFLTQLDDSSSDYDLAVSRLGELCLLLVTHSSGTG